MKIARQSETWLIALARGKRIHLSCRRQCKSCKATASQARQNCQARASPTYLKWLWFETYALQAVFVMHFLSDRIWQTWASRHTRGLLATTRDSSSFDLGRNYLEEKGSSRSNTLIVEKVRKWAGRRETAALAVHILDRVTRNRQCTKRAWN